MWLFYFSTREIKPNQTDIGRKVKVKQTRPPLLPLRKEPLPVPSMRDSLLKPSYQPTVPSKLSPQLVHSSTNGLSNGLGSNHVSSSRPQLNNKKPSVPNVAKRPLKYVSVSFVIYIFGTFKQNSLLIQALLISFKLIREKKQYF